MHHSSRRESIVVLDSDGDQQEYSGSRSKRKDTRDRSTARYRSRSRERHRGSRYHSKVRDRDRDRVRKRDRNRRRRRDYESSDSDSDDSHHRTRGHKRDILFTSEEDLDSTEEDTRDQIVDRLKGVRARSRSQGRLQTRQIISMGPPLTRPTRHMDGKPLKGMEEQETFSQQVLERDGIAIWRAWCLEQKFEDGDWITPEKMIAYVDCEITSRELSAVPTQSVVGSFVRPVLRLWGDQTAGKFSVGSSDPGEHRLQEFSEQIKTLATSSSVDLSASSSSQPSASKSGLDRMEESAISDLKRAQQDAKAKGVTGMLVDPLLVVLLQDQIRFIQALVAPALPAHSGSEPSMSAIAPTPSHHRLSSSPVTPRPTARSKSHPSQKNKFARFRADKIEVPIWYGKDRFSKLKPTHVYLMNPNVKTIQDVLMEWLEGVDGAPSIQELNTKYRAQWRGTDPSEQRVLHTRSCIVREFKRLVVEGGNTEKDALELMEKAASGLQLRTYADRLRTKFNERKRNQELADASRGSTMPVNTGAGPQRSGNRNHKLDEGDKSSEDNVSESSNTEESDKSLDENSIADSTPKAAARRNTTQTVLRDARRSTTTKAKRPVFPFPVNDLENVSDIWQEWYKGWNGDQPLGKLIEQHGRVFYRDPFSRYKHMFYAKQKIVRTLDELIEGGLTKEEAIDKMEYYREGKRPQTLAALIRDIDWTKPMPSSYQQHSTLRQQVDTQEGTHQQQLPEQEQLQQEHQVTEHQPQEIQHQLQDNFHHDGGSFHGAHDDSDKFPGYEMDFSAERAEFNSVSDSTHSYEQDRFMSPPRMALYGEQPELDAVSSTVPPREQDIPMSLPTMD